VRTKSSHRRRIELSNRYRSDLSLLSGFELRRDDALVSVPQSAERLLAFLAVHDRAVERSYVAGSLWLDVTESRASGSLRSALWRVHNADDSVIESVGTRLRLAPHVRVDLRAAHLLARAVLDTDGAGDGARAPVRTVSALDGDLLPDWYVEEWLTLPREQWRQVRLHALEALASDLTKQGDFAVAVSAALASIQGEPLRESAHRCLVQIHLAEGNIGEAFSAFQRFQRLLWREFGVEPSHGFVRLIEGLAIQRSPSPRHP